MNAPGFTPGPLRLGNESDADRVAIISDEVGPGYFGVVGIAVERGSHPVHGGNVSRKTAIANATLWAAAPDLYEALREARAIIKELREVCGSGVRADICGSGGASYVDSATLDAAYVAARAAIAKAEGRQA